MKQLMTTSLLALASTGAFANFSDTVALPTYESPEHLLIGNQVRLHFPNKQIEKLVLANGLTLSYGEIVALAGDFYGIPDAPIVSGENEEVREKLFYDAYNTLAGSMTAVDEAPKILTIIYNEKKQVEDGMRQGEKPADIFARINLDDLISWNCITGGMCPDDYPYLKNILRKIFYLKPGRYLKLVTKDYDHFDHSAWLAYFAGHRVALKLAYEAGLSQDIAKLHTAYALNAYASHFLSDGFASGHLRVQYAIFANKIQPSILASYFTNYMHNEDNQEGITITNLRGDRWQSFGDQYYLDERNQRGRELLREAMQLSADEIYSTYATNVMPQDDKVAALTPDLTNLMAHPKSHYNTAPLFYWDEQTQKVMRRKNLADKYDYEWLEDWNVWSTAVELAKNKGNIIALNAVLLNDQRTSGIAQNNALLNDKDQLVAFPYLH